MCRKLLYECANRQHAHNQTCQIPLPYTHKQEEIFWGEGRPRDSLSILYIYTTVNLSKPYRSIILSESIFLDLIFFKTEWPSKNK